ncbi:MAG: hemolysin family protein [Actinomycetota bacterium]
MSSLWLLLVAVALLVANGFFVGAEFALTASRRSKLEQLGKGGSRSARVALASVRELSLMLAGAQLGITMASLGLGFVAEPAIAHLIEGGLENLVELPAGVLHTISFVIALTIVVFFHMVIGEMAPKNVAIAEPEKSALVIALPFRLFVNLFRPFIHLLNMTANGLLRLMGVEPVDELHSTHSAQEIGSMIAQSAREGMLDRFEHKLLSGAIVFSDLDAASVMVPRTELTALPISATPADIERLVLETGHSRFPVFGDSLDHMLGFFHSKDLLKIPSDSLERPLPSRFVRQMLIVPESKKLHPLLFEMRRERRHFALVIDEHGGTAGVVTIEDLIEELVGEIRDEHDEAEFGIERLGDNRFLAPGSLRIHEAAELLGMNLPAGDYETVAGWIMDRLQRIPRRRDEVKHKGWSVRVRTMHRRRVVQVLIEGPAPADAPRTPSQKTSSPTT